MYVNENCGDDAALVHGAQKNVCTSGQDQVTMEVDVDPPPTSDLTNNESSRKRSQTSSHTAPPSKKARNRVPKTKMVADVPLPSLNQSPQPLSATAHSVISLSLGRCLIDKEAMVKETALITRMVDAATWAVQRTMWFANLVMLNLLEAGQHPPPLNREFMFRCYQYACCETITPAKKVAPFDYVTNEILSARLKKWNDAQLKLSKAALKFPKSTIYTAAQVKLQFLNKHKIQELDASETAAAVARGARTQDKKLADKGAVAACIPVFVEVRRAGGFADPAAWRPAGAMSLKTKGGVAKAGEFVAQGLSDQIEAIIQAELVPNVLTYIKTTYKPRRRLYLEDCLAPRFKTKSHCARVVTHLLRVLDGQAPALVPGVAIDWNSVRNRINGGRDGKLRRSFDIEIDAAERITTSDPGLMHACIQLLQGLGQRLPATPENLEAHPEDFLYPMRQIQLYRNDLLDRIQQIPEVRFHPIPR